MKIKILFLLVIGIIIIYWFSLPENLFQSPISKVVESSDGRLLSARIAADGQWRFPKADSVPYKFKMALITFEDKRFFRHLGVDLLAVGRAVKQNLQAGAIASGASTLTMQTMRISRNKPRSFSEKIVEAILATRLELSHSKEEILLLYASNAPFGGNVVGLDAAAWRYFGRSASELSWAESAMLAVLPNAPSLIHLGRNREQLLIKRNRLLDKLLEEKLINATDCELAKEEELPNEPHPIPMLAPYLLEKNRRTTIDYELQRRVLATAEQHNTLFRSNKVENLAAMVVEVKTGKVIAYVGNIYDNKDNTRGSNVDIIPAPRSSGSVLKPLLYAAMIDDGTILPTMLIPDVPTYFKNFTPSNFNKTFDGAVPANRVLERSLNIPSVLMLDKYGQDKFLYILQKFGFRTINKSSAHYGLSLILGGAEVTMWDLTRAYTLMSAKLCNDSINNISLSGTKEEKCDIPLSKASIWLTFNSLANVNRPEEEGEWRFYDSSRKVAWKTGTSYGNRDAWAIGVTPEYAVCVWVGNSSGEGRPLLTGVGYAAPTLFDIFGLLPPTTWFNAPEIELEPVVVCSKSGYQATEICGERDTMMLPAMSRNSERCPYHKIIHLSEDLKYRVSSDFYPVAKMKQQSWFILPPVQEWYYKRKNLDYKSLPPLMKGMAEINPIDIIYPRSRHVIVLPKGLDGERQEVVFTAVHTNPSATLFWHIDNNFIGTTQGEHKLTGSPSKGKHTLTLIDESGARKSVTFTVE